MDSRAPREAGTRHTMTSTTLAHISDLHLPFEPQLSLAQRLSKRQLSAWSWHRRRDIHAPEVLQGVVEGIRAAAVDHIVITGDIINFSLPDEFTRATRWLSALAPPERISLVPGNHDALVPVPAACGLGQWAPWIRLEKGRWPFVHPLGDVVLIGVNTATVTAPALARGCVGKAQRARLQRVLDANVGRCRIVMLHHPLVAGVVSRRKALADAAAMRDLLAEHGAELVLHGHAREPRFDELRGPTGSIPSICVPSSSALPNPHDAAARWHQLTISSADSNGDSGRWCAEVVVHRWSVEQGAFEIVERRVLRLPSS